MKKSTYKSMIMNNTKSISITGILVMLFLLMINQGCKKDNLTETIATTTTDLSSAKVVHHIGDHFGGGIIFYLNGTGNHGLIAATKDTGDATGKMRWGSAGFYTSGAIGTTIGTGSANTTLIIATEGPTLVYAARLCRAYHGGGHTDWFLPSKDELNQLYLNKSVVGTFIYGAYWSSSEFSNSLAWGKYFYNSTAQYSHKDRFNGVRPVRAF